MDHTMMQDPIQHTRPTGQCKSLAQVTNMITVIVGCCTLMGKKEYQKMASTPSHVSNQMYRLVLVCNPCLAVNGKAEMCVCVCGGKGIKDFKVSSGGVFVGGWAGGREGSCGCTTRMSKLCRTGNHRHHSNLYVITELDSL